MSVEIKDIVSFIGTSAKLDEYGAGYIWGTQPDGSLQMIAGVRGYGAIQNLFVDTAHGGKVDIDKANAFQDAMGRFIAEAITEKIQRLVHENSSAPSVYPDTPSIYQRSCDCKAPSKVGTSAVCGLCGGRIAE